MVNWAVVSMDEGNGELDTLFHGMPPPPHHKITAKKGVNLDDQKWTYITFCSEAKGSSQIVDLFAGELHLNRADILSDGPHVLSDPFTPGVHLLRVDSVLGVQVLDLAVRENPVELQVGPFPHDCGAACGHLEDLFLRGGPRDDVEFLDLGFAEEPAGAATEDGGRGVGVQGGWGESHGGLLGGRLRGFLRHGPDGAARGGGFVQAPGDDGEAVEGLLPGRRHAVGCGLGGGERRGEERGLGCHGYGIEEIGMK
nr:hypothetical protein ACMD2_17739 [Ipomoea batatas]